MTRRVIVMLWISFLLSKSFISKIVFTKQGIAANVEVNFSFQGIIPSCFKSSIFYKHADSKERKQYTEAEIWKGIINSFILDSTWTLFLSSISIVLSIQILLSEFEGTIISLGDFMESFDHLFCCDWRRMSKLKCQKSLTCSQMSAFKKIIFLYDEFMARSSTRVALGTGNYIEMMNILIQLRKICNHPDHKRFVLFDAEIIKCWS